ncbi:hypothetical protein [Labrenzia sp. DG1229]|uniref:hypothetical protein n=1 Tax=Labrenzia sp. DG1229 TaxID=681847 RepID=UPI0012EB497F|nr:hypothetical protein [Labrenzia sp. DG1229]
MEWVTWRAQKHLEKVLELPARGDEQDWDVELAVGSRVEEFIARYQEFQADDEHAYVMASLVIASFDDYLGERLYPMDKEYFGMMRDVDFDVTRMFTAAERRLWSQVSDILKSRSYLFDDLIQYWSVDEEPDGAFACTLFFRDEFRSCGHGSD